MSAEMERPVEMVNIEVDGKAMQAPKGSMIIEATDRAGIEIPRFCYHPKLTIAANCRMCLVDVEKMPKPVPACATPVMDGMKIYTGSRRAVDAQHGREPKRNVGGVAHNVRTGIEARTRESARKRPIARNLPVAEWHWPQF